MRKNNVRVNPSARAEILMERLNGLLNECSVRCVPSEHDVRFIDEQTGHTVLSFDRTLRVGTVLPHNMLTVEDFGLEG